MSAAGDSLLATIHKLLGTNPADGSSDSELLHRFVQLRDEPAFELLVWRHAGLVLSVCRQVLRQEQAVEDAFQATFLVLARKAAGISRREALAGWLHRVAFRIAMRARRHARREEIPAGVDLEQLPAPPKGGTSEEEIRLLHEEILRLPQKYRLPVICCYLEGRTHAEAARELGWCKGTVAGRLARARELLRRRLARRGVDSAAVPAALGSLAGFCGTTGWAGRIGGLVKTLAGIGSPPGGELSAPVVALAEGVIAEMFRTKLKWAAVAVIGVAVAGLGTVLATAKPTPREQAGVTEQRADDENREPERPAVPPRKAADPFDEALQRARVRQQLKTLGLALHNYHEVHGYLLPPAILDKKGQPILSWRVAILPFIEQQALYQQFKLDEPWDSPHNKKLIDRMPAVFATVVNREKPGTTYYQYIVGPEAIYSSYRVLGLPMFGPGGGAGGMGGAPGMPGMPGGGGGGRRGQRGGRGGMGPGGPGGFPGSGGGPGGPGVPGGGSRPGMGVPGGPPGGGAPAGAGAGMPGRPGVEAGLRRLYSITDGTSNTIFVVEAGSPVVWTKPEDVNYDPKKPIPRLGGQFASIIHVLMADGAARSLPRRVSEKTLRALITSDGGEVIDVDAFNDSPGSEIRDSVMRRLQNRNTQLKGEVSLLKDTLSELKQEVDNLRWAVESELLLKLDPKAAALQRENEKLVKTLRDARDEARQLAVEIKRLKDELRKRQKK
jgi:RNA polymerase sigma factor (sigma-70 family)